jgi:hypothetical protein
MKKILVMFATLGLVALLSTPIEAQPTATTTPAMAPAVRVAPMAPIMRAPVMRPTPRPVAARLKAAPKPAAMIAVMALATAPVAAMPAPAAMEAVMAPAAAMAAPDAMAPGEPVEPAKAAPAAKKDSKGRVVGGWILQVILYLLGVFLAAFIPIFTAWLYKKFKLTNLQSKDMIDDIVLKAAMFGIGKAEEASHKLKDNPMDSAKKLDLAIASANKYLVDSGLPEKGTDYLTDVIESALGLNRKEGDGKTAAAKPEEKPEEKAEEKKDEPKKDKDDK